MRRRVLLPLLLLLLAGAVAEARLGGGHSFGGGGGGGGGGHGSGGSGWGGGHSGSGSGSHVDLPTPVLIALVIVAVIIFFVKAKAESEAAAVQTVPSRPSVPPQGPILQRRDPSFSMPLFLDFVQLLYSRFHIQRGTKDMTPLSPYVLGILLQRAVQGTAPGVREVKDVLVASSKVGRVEFGAVTHIPVVFTSNVTETDGTKETRWFLKERWVFSRAAGVSSKPPEALSSLDCPSCGSPSELRQDGSCPHCGQVVRDGRFHWFVTEMSVTTRVPAPPPEISGGEEEGTEIATLCSPTLGADLRAFRARHPEFDPAAFSAFVRSTFLALQDAWSRQAWEAARPLETDALFATHRYWIEQYRSAGLRNVLAEIVIERTITVKVERDAFYEALTVRVYATGLDYTLNSGGKVVGGSQSSRRRFSEYWTFIRRIGQVPGTRAAEGGCPGCGAPLKISMAGICEYCQAKVTSGDFGWVLSAIEQDEEYAG